MSKWKFFPCNDKGEPMKAYGTTTSGVEVRYKGQEQAKDDDPPIDWDQYDRVSSAALGAFQNISPENLRAAVCNYLSPCMAHAGERFPKAFLESIIQHSDLSPEEKALRRSVVRAAR